MTTQSSSQADGDPLGSWGPISFERVGRATRREALGVLLSGGGGAEGSVDQFLAYSVQHGVGMDELWGARAGRGYVSVSLIVHAPGRTAMVFLSPTTQENRAVAAVLARTATLAQDTARVGLSQAILDPWQKEEESAFIGAGFQPLATLIYMQRSLSFAGRTPITIAPDAPPPEPTLELQSWSRHTRQRFESAILESYRDTLDCPGLVGTRHIGDIIASHQASGEFDGSLWWVLWSARGEPAAVMLLSPIPARGAMELVYIGIAPAWRGRGLGKWLVARGLAAARRRGFSTMLLAVDEANAPAMRLYHAFDFSPTARKRALIHTLSPASR